MQIIWLITHTTSDSRRQTKYIPDAFQNFSIHSFLCAIRHLFDNLNMTSHRREKCDIKFDIAEYLSLRIGTKNV